jgi:hypothetical protein
MKTWLASILVPWLLLAWLAPIPGLAAPQQHAKPAAKSAPKQTKPGFETYHAGSVGAADRILSGRAIRSHALHLGDGWCERRG